MECPSCGNKGQQEPFSSNDGKLAYRCAACGRLYSIDVLSIAEITALIDRAKAKADLLATEQARLLEQVARAEEHLGAIKRRNGQ